MLIDFRRNGEANCTIVLVKINTELPNVDAPVLALKWECGKAYQAELLRAHLQNLFQERVREAKREAYEEGWKDAKAKRAKRTAFFGHL